MPASTSEQRDDGLRDVLALVTCYLDGDEEGIGAIVAAQEGDCWPLARAAVGMLIAVLAAASHDVRACVAEARERAETR